MSDERRCADCGHPENDHHYRHPFLAVAAPCPDGQGSVVEPQQAWVEDACTILDAHAQDLGWGSHIYSSHLRVLARAAAATRPAAAQAAEKHAECCASCAGVGRPIRALSTADITAGVAAHGRDGA